MSFYFGSQGNLQSVKVPSTGLERTQNAFRSSGTLTNGGGWVNSSVSSHYTYSMNWDFLRNADYAQIRALFDSGELIHFLDPQAAVSNSLPPYIAQAGDASKGGFRMVGYSSTSVISEISTLAPEVTTGPTRTVRYAAIENAPRKQIWMPIPTGHTMHVRGLTKGSAHVTVGNSVLESYGIGNTPGLDAWFTSLASGTAQALLVGDSITEGWGASVAANRWQTVLQQQLNPSGPVFPFIPAWPYALPTTGFPVERTGQVRNTVAGATRRGFGWRTAEIYEEGGVPGKITFTFTGTSAEIMFSQYSGAGIMTVVVDGGTPIDVNTNSSANGGTFRWSATWPTGPLADGAHTIEVTRSASSTVGQHIWVQGLLTWRGDEAAGVRLLDGSQSGITSNYLTSDIDRIPSIVGYTISNLEGALQAVGGVDLVVIMLGGNDANADPPVPPETYRANIEAFIAQLRSFDGPGAVFTGSILLAARYQGLTPTPAEWQAYHTQLADIAAESADVAYLDLREYMPSVADDTEGLYGPDNVHPTDAGYARMAEIFGNALALTTGGASPIPEVQVSAGTQQGAYLSIGPGDDIDIRWLQTKVLPNGESPNWDEWMPGLGHSGCRLDDVPSYTLYSAPQAIDYGALSLTLRETGAWE